MTTTVGWEMVSGSSECSVRICWWKATRASQYQLYTPTGCRGRSLHCLFPALSPSLTALPDTKTRVPAAGFATTSDRPAVASSRFLLMLIVRAEGAVFGYRSKMYDDLLQLQHRRARIQNLEIRCLVRNHLIT